MNYVIIGNGPAGVIGAETLRKADPFGKITLIGDEPEPPYSRMAIPYLLIGNIGEEGTHLRKTADHFERLAITQVRGRAQGVDVQAKSVKLEDGTTLAYDRLLIATGSHPVKLPIPGIDSPNVHTCWTLADARQIIGKAKPGARVLQIGAGFIGCIIMEALATRGVQLTIVEMGDRMVPRMMTEGAGGMIKKWVEKKGVQVRTNARVEAIESAGSSGLLSKVVNALSGGDSGEAMKARLSTGEQIECDVIIAAAGVKPNIDFLKGSGIDTETGVLVDERMQTNVPGVYAAGDVAEEVEFNTGKRLVNAIQPNAADQARIAALNMVGKGTASQGTMAINVLDALGLISSSFGQWMGVDGGDHAELVDEERFRYLRLEFKDDMLVGATSLGLTEDVGVIRGLIQGKIRLGKWKDYLCKDPTRFKEAYLARTQGTDEYYAETLRHA